MGGNPFLDGVYRIDVLRSGIDDWWHTPRYVVDGRKSVYRIRKINGSILVVESYRRIFDVAVALVFAYNLYKMIKPDKELEMSEEIIAQLETSAAVTKENN